MKLIIFDIDGTILDSVNTDDECFIQTFKDLHQIDLTNVEWNEFNNVTDSGLTFEIFKKWLDRIPTEDEVKTIKAYFYNLLSQKQKDFTEIHGALSFIDALSRKTDFEIGFATGGWKETAELKCNSIGLDITQFIFKSSNDHFNRAKIIELVINEAMVKNSVTQFESIVYFGDGLWDLKTTKELKIDFIGVDFKENNKLRDAAAKYIIKDYTKSITYFN